METKKKNKKVWSVIGNVLIWLFIAFSVLMTVIAFAAQSNKDRIPYLGNTVILTVATDSMSPTIEAGDLILGRKLTDAEKEQLKVDDIITFVTDIDGDGTRELNTHRIVEVNTSGDSVRYKTKGDNKLASEDPYDIYPIDVRSIYEGRRYAGVGKALNFLQSPNGFLVTIVIPLLLFFVLEIYLFIKKLREVRDAGKKTITAADEELIKQRAVEEYLKQQEAEKEKEELIKKQAVEEYIKQQAEAQKAAENKE